MVVLVATSGTMTHARGIGGDRGQPPLALEEEEQAKSLPRSLPAAKGAIGDSTRYDCVCIVLQSTLSLARVRLSR